MAFSKYVALILFSLLFLGSVCAAPGIPHQFYGSVTVNGAPADNATIVAKINGVEYGTTSIDGKYGFNPNIFYVPDPQGNNNGKTIEFLLNDNPVNEPSVIFETGASTQLDLSLGSAPAPSPARGAPAGGGGGGGGSPNKLGVEIVGACVGQPTIVTVLNTFGNPAKGADVLVTFGGKTVAEGETGEDGTVSFTFEEGGEYTFYVTKAFYSQNTKTLTLAKCTGDEGEEEGTDAGEGQGTAQNLCANVDCNDKNPCTSEICATETGHCIYNSQEDGVACGIGGKCQKGVCVEPVEETGGEQAGPTGFFGLGTGQSAGAGIVVVALIALLGYLFAAGKRKKRE